MFTKNWRGCREEPQSDFGTRNKNISASERPEEQNLLGLLGCPQMWTEAF